MPYILRPLIELTREEAMIDTLKLARRLEAANMPTAQAEALAEGLNESLAGPAGQLDKLERDLAVLKWMVGANTALTIVVLGRLLLIHP